MNKRWLHVGSGPHYADGWLNLDLNNHPSFPKQPDILASVFDMHMIEDGSIDKLYCGHLLEHLRWDEEVPMALREMKRVLSPEGVLCVVGPCIEKAILTNQPAWLLNEIPRGWDKEDDPEGFPHRWTACHLLTRIALEKVFEPNKVKEVGIETIHLPEWPNQAESHPPAGAGMWQCSFLVTL